VKAGGGAVTIWSNGATVLGQLGVDMDGAGQLLSTLRVGTSTGRPVATVDLTAIVDRLGAPVRMVPRRVLLERLLEGFPSVWCNARAVGVVSTQNRVRLEFEERIAKLQQPLAASTLGARADYSTCAKPAEHQPKGP
jgi:FAD-dependent urate hydroxylase